MYYFRQLLGKTRYTIFSLTKNYLENMKTYLFGLFFLLCVDCICSSEFNLTLLKEGYDSLIWNKRLNTYVIRRELDTSLFECVRECLKTTRCQSINYAEKYPICELNYETEETHADKLQDEVGFVFGNINYFSPVSYLGFCEANAQ